jgi:Flp pilus assembly protein TadD
MNGQAAELNNASAEDLHRQAISFLTAGDLPAGIRLLERAISKNPQSADIHNDLGTACWQAGDPARAEGCYLKATRLAPQNPFCLSNYGAFLVEQSRYDEAEPLLTRAFALKPDHYEIPNNLGLLRYKRGQLQDAEKLFLQAIRLNPAWSAVHCNLGRVLAQTDRLPMAEKAYRHAIKLNAANAAAWSDLSEVCTETRREEEAADCLKKAIALDPAHPITWTRLLNLLEKKTMLEEGERVLTEAKQRFPGNPGIVLAEAKLLRRQKKVPEAVALMEKYSEKLKKSPARASVVTFFFELGKLYDHLKNADKAFECFVIANRMQKQLESIPQEEDECSRVIARVRATFTPALVPQQSLAQVSSPVTNPVFLIGFPRSGTTLLEQILSSHPDVATMDEREAISKAALYFVKTFGETHRPDMMAQAAKTGKAAWYLANPCYPAALSDLRPADIEEMRRIFFEVHGIGENGPEKKIFIDKLPLNILYVGIIKCIFPDARFILALRHPCDSVLSCFMQQFKLNPYMARFLDLQEAARFYDEAFSLWEHYAKVFELDVHVIRYEDVVADFRPAIEPLLAFLGVPWDDAVLSYDETARKQNIRTPSYHQVTEKIYTRASGRWLSYRKHMESVFSLLEPHALRYGYSMEDNKKQD